MVLLQWFPRARTRVIWPCWTIPTAPPGCECQPESAPGVIVTFETTTSKPFSKRRLPLDWYVPRPNSVLMNAGRGDAAVAAAGTALTATISAANPSVVTASHTPRLIRAFICDSLSQSPPDWASVTSRADGHRDQLPASGGRCWVELYSYSYVTPTVQKIALVIT